MPSNPNSNKFKFKSPKNQPTKQVGWFDHEDHNSGQLSSRLSTDTTHVRGAVGDALGAVVQNLTCMARSRIFDF